MLALASDQRFDYVLNKHPQHKLLSPHQTIVSIFSSGLKRYIVLELI